MPYAAISISLLGVDAKGTREGFFIKPICGKINFILKFKFQRQTTEKVRANKWSDWRLNPYIYIYTYIHIRIYIYIYVTICINIQ